MRCRIFSIEALFLAILCTFSFTVLAQSNEVDWNLDRVTCHEVGAVLTFNATLNGTANAQSIRLSGLPSDVDVANAQIALPEGMRLISTKRFAADADMDAAISRQEKQVEARRLALDLEMALLAALNQEQAFLEANRNIAGNDILLVDDVEEMRNYVVERHEALELERVDLKSNIRGLERCWLTRRLHWPSFLQAPKRHLTPLNWWLQEREWPCGGPCRHATGGLGFFLRLGLE